MSFAAYDSHLETNHTCPRCKYEWNGPCDRSKPNADQLALDAPQESFDDPPEILASPAAVSSKTAAPAVEPQAAATDPPPSPPSPAHEQTKLAIVDHKPPYRIPLMTEIAETERNGLTFVSTFSGCGGSCLGFEMAGYTGLFASEFIPAAAETYRANFPDVPLDTRDIRDVEWYDILEVTGLDVGELDVFEGSPPCASFSTAGKRDAGWGEVKKYSDTKQRTDDLFFEWIRLLTALKPRAFVAENVPGLLGGVARGYFKEIYRGLVEAGYRVEARILDAQWLGVPQRRRRVIFVGVRRDLGRPPEFPDPLTYRYSIRDALAIPADSRIVVDRRTATYDDKDEMEHSVDEPIPTITTNGISGDVLYDWRLIAGADEASIERYAIGEEWKKLEPGGQSERYFNLIRPDADEPVPTITQTGGNVGAASVTHPDEPRKYTIGELKRLSGFPDDFALTGSFTQQWERIGRAVPPPMMRAVAARLAEILL